MSQKARETRALSRGPILQMFIQEPSERELLNDNGSLVVGYNQLKLIKSKKDMKSRSKVAM